MLINKPHHEAGIGQHRAGIVPGVDAASVMARTHLPALLLGLHPQRRVHQVVLVAGAGARPAAHAAAGTTHAVRERGRGTNSREQEAAVLKHSIKHN